MHCAQRVRLEVPEGVLLRAIPDRVEPEQLDAQNGGLSRRKRRSLQRSKRILLHLFAGCQHWKAGSSEES